MFIIKVHIYCHFYSFNYVPIKYNPAWNFWEQVKNIHGSYPIYGARELKYFYQSLTASSCQSTIEGSPCKDRESPYLTHAYK